MLTLCSWYIMYFYSTTGKAGNPMGHKISNTKRLSILLLALCFSAFFLLPIGYILVNTNHTHVCCTSDMPKETPLNSFPFMCCITCTNIYNAKNFITSLGIANINMYAIILWLLALYITLKPGFLHTGSLSLISLKVRMNN